MSTFTTGYDAQYKCFCCEQFFYDAVELSSTKWKCPTCNEYIRIAAPNVGSGHTLIRKKVADLKLYDSVHLPGSKDTYDVLAIENEDTLYLKIALKNFRKVKFKKSDYVSVIDGGYFEEQWKE